MRATRGSAPSRIARRLELLGASRFGCALVVGRDVSAIVAAIAPLAREVAAMDLDAASPREAAYDLPFASERFDLAVFSSSLDRLDAPGRVLAELARVLRPGGRLLLSMPVRAGALGAALRAFGIEDDDDAIALCFAAARLRVLADAGADGERTWLVEKACAAVSGPQPPGDICFESATKFAIK